MIGYYYVKDSNGVRLRAEVLRDWDIEGWDKDYIANPPGMCYIKNAGCYYLDKELLLEVLDKDMRRWENTLQERIQKATEELEKLRQTHKVIQESLK